MSLIAFDENNQDHLRAFHYFAHEAGHPEYLVQGNVSDFDFDFREVLAKKFELDECFVEEPNGCAHKLVHRNGDTAKFNAYYGYEADNNDYDIEFSFDGKLFFDTKTEKVVFEPSINSVQMITGSK